MKTIKKLLKGLLWLAMLPIEIIATFILAVGSLLYGLTFAIKNPRAAVIAIKEITKKIME